MAFQIRGRAADKRTSEGAKFLSDAKKEHAEFFRSLLEKADSFSSVETYTDAIEEASWKFAEQLAKESWRNGVARGQARQER